MNYLTFTGGKSAKLLGRQIRIIQYGVENDSFRDYIGIVEGFSPRVCIKFTVNNHYDYITMDNVPLDWLVFEEESKYQVGRHD